MNPTQYAALKASILADPSLADAVAAADDLAIAAAYNAPASPDYWAWRTSVSHSEVVGITTGDGTTWSWPAFIARSQGERDGWRQMFSGGPIDPSQANVRQGIADIFSGSANNAPQQRAHLLTVARRKASRFEKLFATGDGSTTAPGTLAVEGPLSYSDVSIALRG